MIEKEENKKRYSFAREPLSRGCNPRAVVLAAGEDAVEFLQGQFTQDLTGLADGSARYGFWLNQKGRVLGDAVVAHGSPETLRIYSWSLTAAEMIARLEAYIIADDVELTDETAAWQGWQIVGPGVGEWVGRWREAGEADERVGWVEPNPLSPESIRVVAKVRPDWPDDWRSGDEATFERARILAGVPDVPTDLGSGDFPQEAGQDGVGVSFNKGCYLGQEVMARLANTGRVRRRLGRVAGDGGAPEGDVLELRQAAKRVGELRSRIDDGEAGWVGLAMIGLANFDPAAALSLPDGRQVRWLETKEDSA